MLEALESLVDRQVLAARLRVGHRSEVVEREAAEEPRVANAGGRERHAVLTRRAVRDLARQVEIGPERLDRGVRVEVDAEALHVQAGLARLLDERLSRVELAAKAHEALAHRAKEARLGVEPLITRSFDSHA